MNIFKKILIFIGTSIVSLFFSIFAIGLLESYIHEVFWGVIIYSLIFVVMEILLFLFTLGLFKPRNINNNKIDYMAIFLIIIGLMIIALFYGFIFSVTGALSGSR